MQFQWPYLKARLPLLLLVLIDSMGFGIIFPILSPLFMSDDGGMLSPTTSMAMREFYYGVTLSCFAIFMFFACPMLGDLSDHYGRKKIMMWSLFGTAASSILCAIAIGFKSIALLLVGRILAGLTAGSQGIAQAAIIDLSSKDEKTIDLAIMAFAGTLGFVIGPMLGGIFSNSELVSWFNYATPFYIDACVAAFNALLLYWGMVETNINKNPAKFDLSQGFKLFKDAFTLKELRRLSLVLLMYEVSWAFYFQYISIFLVKYLNYNATEVGYFMSYIGVIIGITFLVILRVLMRYFDERQIVFYSFLLAGIPMLFVTLVDSTLAHCLLAIPISIGIGLIWNSILALFSNAAGEQEQGWVMGVTTSVVSISWVIGSLLTGVMGYFRAHLPFTICGILLLSAGALMFNVGQRK